MILLKQVRFLVFSIFISCVGYGQVMTAKIFSSKDAYVNKPNIYSGTNPATINYGTEQDLKLLRQAGGRLNLVNDLQRSYISFDLVGLISANQIPSNAVVTNATLSFRIGSETGITNTNLLLRKVGSNWTETGITFNNQPTLLSDNQVTTSTKFTGAEFGNPTPVSDRIFDVTGHIQGFIKSPSTFNGWCLSFLDELDLTTALSAVYRSREYTGCYNSGNLSCIPRLYIEYYVPYKLTGATVVNASSATATNGSISPVIVNGSGNNSYKWYKNGGTTVIGTGQNLTGQGPGWYGLEVTGSKGDKFYMAFIIGNECGATAINFKPGPNYMKTIGILGITDFNMYSYNGSGFLPVIGAGYDMPNGNVFSNTLTKFHLWIPGNLEVNQADLKLYGMINTPHEGASNSVFLSRNTADFSVTDSFDSNVYPGPSTTTTGRIMIGTKTGSENAVVDIKNFWNTWKGNNLANYGFTVSSAVTNSPELVSQGYHSSASNDFNLTPEISLVVSKLCNESRPFARLLREEELGAGYVTTDSGKLKFYFEEEYTVSPGKYLEFKIYNGSGQLLSHVREDGTVLLGTVSPVQYIKEDFGRILNISSLGLQSGKYYRLEVKLINGERRFLKFLYKN